MIKLLDHRPMALLGIKTNCRHRCERVAPPQNSESRRRRQGTVGQHELALQMRRQVFVRMHDLAKLQTMFSMAILCNQALHPSLPRGFLFIKQVRRLLIREHQLTARVVAEGLRDRR